MDLQELSLKLVSLLNPISGGLGKSLDSSSQFWIIFQFLLINLPVLGLQGLNWVIITGLLTSYLL